MGWSRSRGAAPRFWQYPVEGVAKAVGEEGAMGIFKGGLTAASAGIAAALVFGYLGALVFKPKMKE